MTDDIKTILQAALDDTNADLKSGSQEIVALMAQRAAELSTIVGLPGYDQAAIAARDEIALRAGLELVGQADKAASRVLSIVQGGLLLIAGSL